MLDPTDTFPDYAAEIRTAFDARLRDKVARSITPELIAEYRANPYGHDGQQSDALLRVLNYLRKRPIRQKYALETLKAFEAYRIVRLSGVRPLLPEAVDERIYKNKQDADFDLFMLRLNEVTQPESAQ